MLATFNGERTLPAVLRAYRDLQPPSGGWKLVVADNASTDSTTGLLREFQSQLPLTRVYVPARGKNHALNAALEQREGDLVVFTDDDAVPAVNWLEEMRKAADANPEFDLFGGAIVPRWEQPPPSWVIDWVPHDMTYSLTPPAQADGPIPASQVCGPNMAVRAALFDSGHRFDVRIGPQAGVSYTMGSETEFTVRMEQMGHRARFVGAAAVEHIVRAFQMERAWVLGRAVRYGRCIYRRDRQRGIQVPATVMGMPRWQVRRLFSGALSLLGCRLSGDERGAFAHAWTLRFDWGYVTEARRASMAHDERSP